MIQGQLRVYHGLKSPQFSYTKIWNTVFMMLKMVLIEKRNRQYKNKLKRAAALGKLNYFK